LGSHCDADSSRTDAVYGVTFADYDSYLPVAPIQQPWTAGAATAGYGGVGLPQATFEQRVDLDLHNRIPGNLIATQTAFGDILRPVVFDPSVLGSGTHKVAILRNQPNGNEQISALLVIDVAVGPGTTTGPPVVPPVVPPVTPPVTQLLPAGTYRLCDATGKCVDLVIR
jgi:hypothetical protein